MGRELPGRIRAGLQSSPVPESKGQERFGSGDREEINTTLIFTSQPDEAEKNRRDTEGGQA